MTSDDEGAVGEEDAVHAGEGAAREEDAVHAGEGAVGAEGAVGDDAERKPGSGGDGADPAVRDAVRDDLAELVDANPDLLEDDDADGDEADLPSFDDPVSPQAIDVEHAAFVVVGVVATVGLVVLMLGGF